MTFPLNRIIFMQYFWKVIMNNTPEKMSVLILGSGSNVLQARDWDSHPFDWVVAINNAWLVRDDWSDLIYPFDFPDKKKPKSVKKDQNIVTQEVFFQFKTVLADLSMLVARWPFPQDIGCRDSSNPWRLHFLAVICIIQNWKRHISMVVRPQTR